jgi:hypothetical protein
LLETLGIAVLPSGIGTALGMFEPFRRGHRIPILGAFSVSRYDWWPYLLVPFVLYAAIAFALVHFIYRSNEVSLNYSDFVQYALTAWMLSGYVCALPALLIQSQR